MDTLSNLISLEILITPQFELLPVFSIAFILCFFPCLFLLFIFRVDFLQYILILAALASWQMEPWD